MENSNLHVKTVVADPTPLGLAGLAMVTLVASSQKLGISDGVSLIVPWAIFLGAIAQIMAGIFDFKHNNLFGAIAFSAYGFFWLAVASTWLIKAGCFGTALQETADTTQLAFGFLGYFVISLIITVTAFRINTHLSILMLLIDMLLLSLTMDAFGAGHVWHTLAAYSELLISIGSFYGVAASMINKSYERVIIPTGKAWTR